MSRPGVQPRRRFTLTVEDAGDVEAPAEVRLRRLLKAMLRGYGFRAVSAVESTPVAPPAAQELAQEETTR
jgi:hypothetical protein